MNEATSNAGVALFAFLAVSSIALFTFVSIATWAGTRQKEREAYYKADMMKRIAETGGERNPALEYLREQERIAAAKRTAGFKLGGIVNVGIGVALMILLRALVTDVPVYLAGLFPLVIGMSLLLYVYGLEPKRTM